MSDRDDAVRKRFMVNGETSAALDLHGPYLKPAHRLLDQVVTRQLVQHQSEIDHDPVLVATHQHGDTTRRHYASGATLRASDKGGRREITIDAHCHHVDTTPPGGGPPKPLPYLWVGARIKDAHTPPPGQWIENWGLILGVWEPDDPQGRPRGLVCSHPPVRAIDHVTPRRWDGQDGTEAHTTHTSRSATASVTFTEHGLYMASASWHGGTFLTGYTGPMDWCLQAPFDPMRRDRPDEQTYFNVPGASNVPLWAHVVVLDAWPEAAPTDGRELLQIPEGLRALDISPAVLAGPYVVKVGLSDWACDPVVVEIEVRVNKLPLTVIKRYEVTIDYGTEYFRLIPPYGVPTDLAHGCDHEVGNNPHWRNWWGGALLVDVLGGTIEPRSFHLPSHGFATGPWNPALGCDTAQSLPRVLFFALQYPFSAYYMGPHQAQVLAVVDYSFEANATTESTGLEAKWGRASEYPVSALNPYWRTEGTPPQIPDGLTIRIDRATAHGINDGVVYQVIYDPRLDWPWRFAISTRAEFNSQTLAGDPFAYQAEMIGIALGLGAENLFVTVPGAHFNEIDLEFDEFDCPQVTDTQTDGSAAVEVPPPFDYGSP